MENKRLSLFSMLPAYIFFLLSELIRLSADVNDAFIVYRIICLVFAIAGNIISGIFLNKGMKKVAYIGIGFTLISMIGWIVIGVIMIT